MHSEMRRFMFLLGGGIVFLVSAMFSYGELRYALFGTETEAKILRVLEGSSGGRRGRSHPILMVEYQFTDPDGTVRKESDTVGADWPVARAGLTPVQFIPGSVGSSRLEGHTQTAWVYVFLGSLAFLGFLGFRFWRLYKS